VSTLPEHAHRSPTGGLPHPADRAGYDGQDHTEPEVRGCFIGDGCLGQHLLAQHIAIDEIVNEPLCAAQIESIVEAVTAPLAEYRGVPALAAENDAMSLALAELAHEFVPPGPGWQGRASCFGRGSPGNGRCAQLAGHPVHRTPAVVRAEMEARP
jgi:hypothetical protein